MMTSSITTMWLDCVVPRPESQHRLICFPHASGSTSLFCKWGTGVLNCEVYAVRYPGRAERIDEPLPTDLQQMALEIAKAIKPLAEALPVALFGHSMGAVVALETARALEAHNICVTHLFASGSRNGLCSPTPITPTGIVEDDDAVCQQLIKMGGTDPRIASDPIFRELILPVARADSQMFHRYEMELEPTLKCPVTTIFGDTDEDADIRPWKNLALAGFKEQCVSGGHFYLISSPPFAILEQHLLMTK